MTVEEIILWESKNNLFSEGDMGVRDLRDPAVGDSSAERIPRKVTDRVAPAVECLLNEGQPMFP